MLYLHFDKTLEYLTCLGVDNIDALFFQAHVLLLGLRNRKV
jgi:hypothetical protein